MTFTESSDYRILVSLGAADRGRLDPLTRKLRSFRALPVGWSHGEGVPVTEDAVRIAEYFVEIATGLQVKADVFPGLHGDCAVAFYQGDRSVEVVVHPGGGDSFGLHVEVGKGFQFETLVQVDNASHADVVRQIIQLVPEAWKSPASSRFVNLTGSSAGFQMSFSSTPQESPLAHLTAS